jgi:hypothetical protein
VQTKENSSNSKTSTRKVEANRQNAQRSTGPKTPEGKAKSSQNSITHGIFVKKFLNGVAPETVAEIEALAAGVREHYQPVGILEELLVQKIVIELARDHRVLGVEQEFHGDASPMLLVARLGLMTRYTTSTSRALYRAIQELERVQAIRKARESSAISPTGEPRLPITTEEQFDSDVADTVLRESSTPVRPEEPEDPEITKLLGMR